MGCDNVISMLSVGDWILTDAHIESAEEKLPNFINNVMRYDDAEWQKVHDCDKLKSVYRHMNYLKLHKRVHNIKGDSVAYKEKNRLHWVKKSDISLIFRFEYKIENWYMVKNNNGFKPMEQSKFPTNKTIKNAEYVKLSKVGNNIFDIYKIKKEQDNYSVGCVNWGGMGYHTHEDGDYFYYAVKKDKKGIAPHKLSVFRTKNIGIDNNFFLNTPNFFPAFLDSIYNPLDNGTSKVLL